MPGIVRENRKVYETIYFFFASETADTENIEMPVIPYTYFQ